MTYLVRHVKLPEIDLSPTLWAALRLKLLLEPLKPATFRRTESAGQDNGDFHDLSYYMAGRSGLEYIL